MKIKQMTFYLAKRSIQHHSRSDLQHSSSRQLTFRHELAEFVDIFEGSFGEDRMDQSPGSEVKGFLNVLGQ